MRNNPDKEYYEAAAKLFKELLSQRGWGQKQLGTALGKQREDVNSWLNGRKPLPPEAYAKFLELCDLRDPDMRRLVHDRRETDFLGSIPLDRSVLGPAPAFVTAKEYAKIAAELAVIQEHERRALLDDAKKLLEAFRHTYEHLTERDLPWAYHVFGDVLLQRGEYENAAQAYLNAIEGFTLRRLDSRFQRARAYQRLARSLPESSSESLRWRREACQELNQCLHDDRVKGVDPKIYADHLKCYADWVITYDLAVPDSAVGLIGKVVSPSAYQAQGQNSTTPADVAQIIAQAIYDYQLAIRAYEAELDSANKRQVEDRAHCYTNIAWCHIMDKQPQKALELYTEALKLRVRLGQDDQTAYIMKFLAVAYWAMALRHSVSAYWGLAEWCAQTAVILYQGIEASLEDKLHATNEVLERILAAKPDTAVLPQTPLPPTKPSGKQVYELYLAAAKE